MTDSIFPIPLQDMAMLKGMFREEATVFLNSNYPSLSQADVDALLRLAMTEHSPANPTPRPTAERKASYIVDPARNYFILAASLSGVSQYQLSRLHGIARQTIYVILRQLRKPEYDILRKHNMKYSDAETTAMYEWYFSNASENGNLPLHQLVAKLESVALHARTSSDGE